MEILILTFFIIILTICLYIFIRNNSVYRFKTNLNDLSYSILSEYLDNISTDTDNETFKICEERFEELRNIWHSINDISYNKMLYSLKPLKPDRWLTKEQLEFLKL